MKLCTFEKNGLPALGAIKDDAIVDLTPMSDGGEPADMLDLLRQGDEGFSLVADYLRNAPYGFPVGSAKILSPVLNPTKIMAIGLNYMDHVEESGLAVPEIAVMFAKFPSAIIGQGAHIQWSRSVTRKVDYEVELAVVIGKVARNVSHQDAMDYVAGYTICNDVSARDLQLEKGDQWLRGKSLDTFCPLGPYLITKDEIRDPHNLAVSTTVNGEIRQDSSTRYLIYKIPELIEYLSAAFTLLPGDIIATGTPAGVGAFSNPPVWLKNGDEVVVSIEGLGALHNKCVESE